MHAELVRVEEGVGVGADAVERHEPEVEQATPTDDHVESEREQHVERRVERDAADVAATGDDWEQRERGDEEDQPRVPGRSSQAILDLA